MKMPQTAVLAEFPKMMKKPLHLPHNYRIYKFSISYQFIPDTIPNLKSEGSPLITLKTFMLYQSFNFSAELAKYTLFSILTILQKSYERSFPQVVV
jgi:hypothetical protein